MGEPRKSVTGIYVGESSCQRLLCAFTEKGSTSALDADLIKSMEDMGKRDPVTRVMLERVCAWKAGDPTASPSCNATDSFTVDASEEDLVATDDPAAALIDSILNIAGPKVAIFPDSFPIELEKSYLLARSCGSITALTLIQDAAEKQHHLAEACLSALYERGCERLPSDHEQAVLYASRSLPWLQGHARRGNKYAQYHLGCCCEDGRGVEKNETEAVRWYTLAAEQGHAPAQCNLGICFENGTGVGQDMTEAVRLYTLAADQGLADAQKCLGVCYEHGIGVAEDRIEAIRMYKLAAEQSHIIALTCLEALLILPTSTPSPSLPESAPAPAPAIAPTPPPVREGFFRRLFGGSGSSNGGGDGSNGGGDDDSGGETETSEDNAVTISDFDLLSVIGKGRISTVMLAQKRTAPGDGQVYAIKVFKKADVVAKGQVERTLTERTILANVRYPFIVGLHYAFQSEEKLYMVMDFVQGGDFFTLMRKFKRIPEDWTRLYVIEVAMALQHLHDLDIVYRGLEPENILLCSDGHLKLTDFGVSRFFETRPPAPEDVLGDDNIVTRSFCGTEQYMSPEMLLQQGHNFRTDWWCLGLLMHEMISARHPFNGPSHYDTLRNMVTKPPFIDPRLSPGGAAVVKQFLVKNPRERLCGNYGSSELKALPYFGIIDWDALYHRRIAMPYKPNLAGDIDVSSFEGSRERLIDTHFGHFSEGADVGKKKASRGGLLGIFGYGKDTQAANAKIKAQADNDVFKGFSFAADESAAAAESDELL